MMLLINNGEKFKSGVGRNAYIRTPSPFNELSVQSDAETELVPSFIMVHTDQRKKIQTLFKQFPCCFSSTFRTFFPYCGDDPHPGIPTETVYVQLFIP